MTVIGERLFSYYGYRCVGAVVPHTPPRLGYAAFRHLGDLAYLVSSASRKAVLSNLRHVVPATTGAEELASIARQVFRYQAYNYFDLFRLGSLTAEEIRGLVAVHGWEHAEEALAGGRGVIVISIHFGNLDIVAQSFAVRNCPFTVLAEHIQPEKLYRYVTGLRSSQGIRILPADKYLRPLFKALRNNELIGVAADRNLTGKGTVTQFFGAPALLPDAHVRLALHTGAALLPIFSFRKPDYRFDAFLEPPLFLQSTGDAEGDTKAGMDRLVRVLEKYIVRHPEQWVLFEPVWPEA